MAFALPVLFTVLLAGTTRTTTTASPLAATAAQVGVCRFEAAVYNEGDAVVTAQPCARCVCLRGAVVCRVQVCAALPHPPPPGCIVVHRNAQCCAQLHCNDDRQRLASPGDALLGVGTGVGVGVGERPQRLDDGDVGVGVSVGGCLANGTLYGEGSAMATSTLCEFCYCIRGQQQCVRPKCDIRLPGCRPVFNTHACCPTSYVCTPTAGATKITEHSTTLAEQSTPTLAGDSPGCWVDGERFSEGVMVSSVASSECENCFCAHGAVRCVTLANAPPLQGCAPIVKPGECWPASYNCSGTTMSVQLSEDAFVLRHAAAERNLPPPRGALASVEGRANHADPATTETPANGTSISSSTTTPGTTSTTKPGHMVEVKNITEPVLKVADKGEKRATTGKPATSAKSASKASESTKKPSKPTTSRPEDAAPASTVTSSATEGSTATDVEEKTATMKNNLKGNASTTSTAVPKSTTTSQSSTARQETSNSTTLASSPATATTTLTESTTPAPLKSSTTPASLPPSSTPTPLNSPSTTTTLSSTSTIATLNSTDATVSTDLTTLKPKSPDVGNKAANTTTSPTSSTSPTTPASLASHSTTHNVTSPDASTSNTTATPNPTTASTSTTTKSPTISLNSTTTPNSKTTQNTTTSESPTTTSQSSTAIKNSTAIQNSTILQNSANSQNYTTSQNATATQNSMTSENATTSQSPLGSTNSSTPTPSVSEETTTESVTAVTDLDPALTEADLEDDVTTPTPPEGQAKHGGDTAADADLVVNVTMHSNLSIKEGNASAGEIVTERHPAELEAVVNVTLPRDTDYEYDYNEPSLPPSLPNLRIIPFVAADAVVESDSPKQPAYQLSAEIQRRTDSPVFYKPAHANRFSPPAETQGGFLPREPIIDGPFYETKFDGSYHAANTDQGDQLPLEITTGPTPQSITVPPSSKDGSDHCVSNGHEFHHGQMVSPADACIVCVCYFGEVHCHPPKCPTPSVGCRRMTDAERLTCCGRIVCDEESPTVVVVSGAVATPGSEAASGLGLGASLPVTVADGVPDLADPFRDVIRTEAAPDLPALFGGIMPYLQERHSATQPPTTTPTPSPWSWNVSSATPDAPTDAPATSPSSESPSDDTTSPVTFTTLLPKPVSSSEEPVDAEDGFSFDSVLQLLFSGGETTTTPTPAERRADVETPDAPRPIDGDAGAGAGLLKLAGCNIYGRMYRVGRLISELSGPCLECRCTEVGVQCRPLAC